MGVGLVLTAPPPLSGSDEILPAVARGASLGWLYYCFVASWFHHPYAISMPHAHPRSLLTHDHLWWTSH